MLQRKEKKTKHYAFWRQIDEKPSIILSGCPGFESMLQMGMLWTA